MLSGCGVLVVTRKYKPFVGKMMKGLTFYWYMDLF